MALAVSPCCPRDALLHYPQPQNIKRWLLAPQRLPTLRRLQPPETLEQDLIEFLLGAPPGESALVRNTTGGLEYRVACTNSLEPWAMPRVGEWAQAEAERHGARRADGDARCGDARYGGDMWPVAAAARVDVPTGKTSGLLVREQGMRERAAVTMQAACSVTCGGSEPGEAAEVAGMGFREWAKELAGLPAAAMHYKLAEGGEGIDFDRGLFGQSSMWERSLSPVTPPDCTDVNEAEWKCHTQTRQQDSKDEVVSYKSAQKGFAAPPSRFARAARAFGGTPPRTHRGVQALDKGRALGLERRLTASFSAPNLLAARPKDA